MLKAKNYTSEEEPFLLLCRAGMSPLQICCCTGIKSDGKNAQGSLLFFTNGELVCVGTNLIRWWKCALLPTGTEYSGDKQMLALYFYSVVSSFVFPWHY